MIAFNISEEHIKFFMNKLLKTETFDFLDIRNFYLETLITYDIKGKINKTFFNDEEINQEYIKWKDLKPTILNLVAGNKKPNLLKIVFSLPKDKLKDIDENAAALFLNITYSKNELLLTTGTAQKNFSLDKKIDSIWDDRVLKFLEKNDIVITP